MQKPSGIGGQAVLEGIMMRHEGEYAIAVRKSDGEIVVKKEAYTPTIPIKNIENIPILRGVSAFVDALFIGVKCLWGELTDKNNPNNETYAGSVELMAFPEGCYVMDPKRPYVEVIAGIHNIFKILHVEYVQRLNYTSLPTAQKRGVRMMVRMTF